MGSHFFSLKFFLFFFLLCFGSGAFGDETVWKIEWTTNSGGGSRVILLTGFGPFGGVPDNPSGRIVHGLKEEVERKCQPKEATLEAKVLKVFPGVIQTILPLKSETIISLGVHAGPAAQIRLETAARNHFYDPFTGEDGPIDPTFPKTHVVFGPPIPESIPPVLEGFDIVRGNETSAGTYVCNDTFYRLCRKEKAGYFIHIPPIQKSQDGRLTRAMGEIACKIFDFQERIF